MQAMFDVFQPAAREAMMEGVVAAAGSYGAVGIRHWWLDCDELAHQTRANPAPEHPVDEEAWGRGRG